jgi:hypothetical protein
MFHTHAQLLQPCWQVPQLWHALVGEEMTQRQTGQVCEAAGAWQQPVAYQVALQVQAAKAGQSPKGFAWPLCHGGRVDLIIVAQMACAEGGERGEVLKVVQGSWRQHSCFQGPQL